MSAKLSSSMAASAGSTSASAATKAAPAAGATAAGSAGADGVSSAAGSRSSSGAGGSTGPNIGASARFSAAMADAAQAGDQAVNAQIRDSKPAPTDHSTDASGGGTKADTKAAEARDTSAAEAYNAAGDAVAATVRDAATNALAAATQNAVSSKITAPDQAGSARAASTASKPGGGTRAAGKDTTSAVTMDPVALAMLLAISGMQMSGGAGANGASENLSSASADVGSGRRPAMDASSAVMPSALAARDAPPAMLDATDTAITTGAALSGKSTSPDSQAAPTSIVPASAGLPDLVRNFTNDSAQTPTVQATISVPVASGSWPHAVAAQVHWFVSNDVQSATLRLSPEHLGPVEVHIDVQKSQVNVNFSAAHAETRAALEQTVPRLREIFASGGLTLGQANVQQDPRPGSQSTAAPVRATFAHAQTVEPVAIAAAQSLGLVDEYV
jgi:flagellar hook-length control protein FliK